jgi:hypothetical protein
MSQNESDSDPAPSQHGLRKLGAPVGAALALLLVFGGYYLFYARKNSDYLIHRNYRLLATLGSQVGQAIESERKALRTLQVFSDDPAKVGAALRKFTEQYDFKLSEFQDCVGDTERRQLRDDPKAANQNPIYPTLERRPDGYRVSFHYLENPCGWVGLNELLEPIFGSREAFDGVLLANGNGDVVYQRPALGLHRLEQLQGAARAPRPKGDDKAEGAGVETVLAKMTGSSRAMDGEVGGRDYKVFVQPVGLPMADAAATVAPRPAGDKPAAGVRDKDKDWMICGLVASDKLSSESLAVPPSYLAAAVAALLLCLLSWPILKLVLLGERQRVRLLDLLMVSWCSLLGVSLLTLFLLDFVHHGELERLADEQTGAFAQGMADNLQAEIRSAYGQLETLEGAVAEVPPKPGGPSDLLDERKDLITKYPFFDAFMLFDVEGEPQLKWTTDALLLPTRSVAARDYFKRTVRGELWPVPAREGESAAESSRCDASQTSLEPDPRNRAADCFVLESVSSLVTGVRMGLLAKLARGGLPDEYKVVKVATLSLPMLSVIHPVLPPDLSFAVIDPSGKVLFHSDTGRNLVENLFDETDQDRRLRSAVLARNKVTLNLRYWGEDFKVSTAPVDGPPWTVVALQDRGPVEAVNLESVLSAAVFLIFFVGLFALVPTMVALVRPAYRAEWLWPAPERSNDYVRLVAVYLLLLLAFIPAVFLLAGSDRLVGIACLLALLALVLGYLQLTQHARRRPAMIAWGLGLALLCLGLGGLLAPSEVDAGSDGQALRDWLPLASTLAPALAAAFVVLVRPQWWRRRTRRRGLALPWAYPALGALLLLLAAVLPTVCIFKLAQRIQTDCWVKHGQLDLARAIRKHDNRVARTYRDEWGRGKTELAAKPLLLSTRPPAPGAPAGGRPGPAADPPLDFYGGYFFGTRLAALETEAPGDRASSGAGTESHGGEHSLLPEFLEDLLPTYSKYSAETRELLRDRATGGGWHWHRRGGRLELERPDLDLALETALPRTWLSGALPEGGSGGTSAGAAHARGPAEVALIAVPLLLLLAGLAWFISRRVFLVDLFEPLWSGREGDLPATVGSNVFLISRRREWHVRDRERRFFCLHLGDLENGTLGWPERRLELLRSLPARNILVDGFEQGILDPAFNDRKLALLEELVKERTVVVLSTVSPAQLCARQEGAAAGAPSSSPASEERWRDLLGSFTVIDEDTRPRLSECGEVSVLAWKELQDLLRSGWQPAEPSHWRSAWLRDECGGNPFLTQIGHELDLLPVGLDRRQLLEEFSERAEVYYRSLWESCNPHEKVVLGHLAEDGLINEKDRRVVRRLMARGLVRRAPVFRLINETFRRYVVSPVCRNEVVELEQGAGASPWDRFRRPFFGALAVGVVFFFATQKQLLDGSMAIATAFTAGLPVVVKALDLLSGRHAAAAAK